jgi:hypothetical protein
MNYKGLPMTLVQRVPYTEVQQYALSKGWQRVPGVKGDIAVYRRPESRKREVIIPQDRGFSDYALRMAEAISAFTDFEQIDNDHRTPQQVLNDLLLPAADILRFSLEGTPAQDGTVSLNEAVNLIGGARKALMASACTVIHPQKFHPRMSRTETEQFINACRLGQTEQGSFVTTFICPLNALPKEELPVSAPSDPSPKFFTREVTQTLMFSLQQIVEAVKADQAALLLDPQRCNVFISANLCEALVELQPVAEETIVSVYPTWSRTIAPPPNAPGKVRFSKEYFPIIEDVARQLRPDPGLREAPYIIGWVDALDGKPGPDNRLQGLVTLEIPLEGMEKFIKARLDLTADDYEKAIKAHMARDMVRLAGVLHRGPRVSVIRNYREFENIDEMERAAHRLIDEYEEHLKMHETPPSYGAPKQLPGPTN